MVRRSLWIGTLAAAGLLGAAAGAPAATITLTGDVEKDFDPAKYPNATIGIYEDKIPTVPGLPVPTDHTKDISIPQWMRDEGRQTGMNFKDFRLHYDQASDTLFVGVNTYGIAGDIDGDGDPGRTDPRTATSGGIDVPNMGGRETMVIAFDLDKNGVPDVVAGIPVNKEAAGPGLIGFNVAKYKDTGLGLPYGFGETLHDHLGGLAFNPSSATPDFEFWIKNFSKLPGFDMSKGFNLSAFSGALDGIIIGEDTFYRGDVQPQAIPEPTTVLAWSVVVAGGAALRYRRRLRRATA